MSYISLEEDIFEIAKKRSLSNFFANHLHAAPKKSGAHMRIDACPACGPSCQGSQKVKIKDDRTWRCYVCDQSGTVIDAVMAMRIASTPLAAAQYITGNDHTALAASPEVIARRKKERDEVSLARITIVGLLQTATRNCWSKEVEHYLTEVRCFSRATVIEAHKRGMIGLMPSYREGNLDFLKHVLGIDLMLGAKVYDEANNRSWLSSYPLIQFMPGNAFAEVRRIWMPTPKPGDGPAKKSLGLGIPLASQYPYFWHSTETERCLLTEGLMDLMAAVAQGYPNLVIATPGICEFKVDWFVDMHRRGVKVFDLGYDNDLKKADNPGQTMQRHIAKELDKLGIPWANASPPDGDINDQLIKAVRKRTTLRA